MFSHPVKPHFRKLTRSAILGSIQVSAIALLWLLLGPGISPFFTLGVDARAWGYTVSEAEAQFLANTSKLESGSITYRIEYFYPKDNLLGVFDQSMMNLEEMGFESPPFFSSEDDLHLHGVGTFKWKGPKFLATTRHVRLGNTSADALETQIGHLIDCWNGENLKSLLSVHRSSQDAFSEEVDFNSTVGPPIMENGVILPSPRSIALSLGFLAAGPYCPSLSQKRFSFVSQFDSVSEEDGLLRLTRNAGSRIAFLDPNRSCIPIRYMTQSPTMPVLREIEYQSIDGVYFPVSSVTTRYREGDKVYLKITATLESYEFNVDYSDDDFEAEFLEGVEVKDETIADLGAPN